jgi:DNA-binding transcriptional MerR regulator
VDIHKINKIMCDLEKCKLMQKALDLGLSIKNIVECLIECDYLDEEKFFEKLIESVVKSTDGQKGNNKDESYDMIDTFAQEGNPAENREENVINKSQLGVQKHKNAIKLNSNLRPIIVDGIDVATR